MEIQKIINQLKEFHIKTVVEIGEPTYIQTHKMINPGNQVFYSACIYVGYASELPLQIDKNCQANVICIEDAQFSKDFIESGQVNLYTIPRQVNQFDVLNRIADILIDEATLVASMRRILDALYENTGIQALVDVASEVFENPIFINDTAYKILAMSRKVVFENECLEEEKTLGYIHASNILAMKRDGIYADKLNLADEIVLSKRDDTKECWMFKNVRIHGIVVANIAIVDEQRPFRKLDYELMNRFAQVIAIEMEKNDFYKDNRGVMYSYFLDDLLTGKMNSQKAVIQRLSILNWKTYEWFKVAVIVDSQNEIQKEKQEYIVQYLKKIMPDCHWTVYKKKIVIFLSRPNKKIFTEKEQEELTVFLKSNKLIMGISHSFTNLLEASRYHKQAFRAVSAGVFVKNKEVLFRYTDMMPYYVAEAVLKRNDVSEFCPESISIIQKYDEEKGTNMVETLEKYLLHVGDPVTAAKALNIHRNTLLYRINKIKDLTDINLENGDERLVLQLYFKFLEYQRGSWIK